MDTRNVFAKLASSRAFVFALLVLGIVGALVAAGKVPYSELTTTAKWLGAIFIGGKSAEGLFAPSQSAGAVASPAAPPASDAAEALAKDILAILSPEAPATPAAPAEVLAAPAAPAAPTARHTAPTGRP